MIDGLLILLFFQFLGEILIRLTGIPLPASVVGMVLLLVALLLNTPFTQRVAPAAGALIKHIRRLRCGSGRGRGDWHHPQHAAGDPDAEKAHEQGRRAP